VQARRGGVGLVAGDARIRRLLFGAEDREREGIEDGRVRRRVARRGQRVGRRAGEALVQVQRDAPVPARREERIGQRGEPGRSSRLMKPSVRVMSI